MYSMFHCAIYKDVGYKNAVIIIHE
jgi:hypothetical protein